MFSMVQLSSDSTPSANRARRFTVLGFASWAIAALGSAAILAGVMAPEGGVPALDRLKRDITRVERRNQDLRVQNAELRAQIRAAERDPETLEWQARYQLHFVRDSELVFRGPLESSR
jgi:cell division protein FtsB